jgi:hypothetical protein
LSALGEAHYRTDNDLLRDGTEQLFSAWARYFMILSPNVVLLLLLAIQNANAL